MTILPSCHYKKIMFSDGLLPMNKFLSECFDFSTDIIEGINSVENFENTDGFDR